MRISPKNTRALFPEKGMTREDVEKALQLFRAEDEDPRATFGDRWLNDRDLLLDDGVLEVAKNAHLAFFTKNNSYPPVMAMEHDLISMALELFHGGTSAGGRLTSGGSESLFLATAAALSEVRARHPKLAELEIVLPENGYPTFEKYSRYLGYRVRRVAVDGDFRADPSAFLSAVNDNTAMMVASVSSWAHGACDPVAELSEIAKAHAIWLHVDGCVGGFLAPFARDLGRNIPDFDFRVPGVASISADFHKYGYGAKGVSGIFFRDRRAARQLTFVFDAWAAGLYRSPVFTGTRSGGAIAAAWAVARYLGREGYRARAAQILKVRDAIVSLVTETPELTLIGRAELGTVAVGGWERNIYAVADALKARGWAINLLKDPPGIQFVLGPLRDEYVDLLVSDIRASVQHVRGNAPSTQLPQKVVYSDEVLDEPGIQFE